MAYQIFVDLDATALEGGAIYLGQPNADPEQSPIDVFWDEGRTTPAQQPLRTSGGVIVRDGTPADVFSAVNAYSIRVRNRAGSVVWYKPTTGGNANSRLTFPIPAGPPGKDGDTGPQGGNIESIGTFIEAASISGGIVVPPGTTRLRFSGYSVAGVGGGIVDYDASINALNLGNYPGWAFLRSGGGGFKLTADQPLNYAMFGARAEFVSASNRGFDNTVAYQRLRSFLTATGSYRSIFYRYARRLDVSLGQYYHSDSFDLDFASMFIAGERTGATDSDGRGGTVFVFAENKSGIIIESADTKGEGSRPISPGSTGSTIDGITVQSLGGAINAAADGFRARGQFAFFNCIAIGFPRHGFNMSADLSGQGGNINSSFIMNCTAVRNYFDGFLFAGGDGNAITAVHLNALYNGRCGINMAQFLANSLFGFHLEGNGTNDSGPRSMPQQPGAQCYYQGSYYVVYPGRAADASNSTPGADRTIWVRIGAGTPHPVYPTYVQGPAWSEGSAMRITGANAQTVSAGGYAEPGQPPVFVGGGGMQIGGQMDAGVIGSQAYAYVSGGMLTSRAWQALDGRGTTIIGGDYARQRLLYMRGPAGFEYEWSYDLTGGIFLRWAGQKTAMAHSVDANENVLTRIAFPILNTVRVPNATAPVATGAVSRTMPIYDETGAELGVIEIKARA